MQQNYQMPTSDNDDNAPVNKLMSAVTSHSNNDATVIQIRLDTEPLIEKIQLFLEGLQKVTEFDEENGIKTVKLVPVGEAKANKKGIHSLMFFVSSTISVPVVQGNYKEDWFRSYCAGRRQELADTILLNQNDWEISDSNFEHIIDVIMGVVEPYMTRTIDNKEREAHNQSSQYIERIGDGTNNNGGGMFGFLRGR